MSNSTGGKGSKPRPISIANEDYKNRWDAIFARDLEKKVCPNKNEKGFCPNHNLQCGYPDCEK